MLVCASAVLARRVSLSPASLLVALAAALGLGVGCTTPLPLLFDAGVRDDARGLDAPIEAPDAPEASPDAPPSTDAPAPSPDSPGAIGAPCAGPDDCTAGACVDGVCCQSACGGACMACASALTGAPNGSCAPVTAGMDPADECAASAPSSCGTSGACDGAGACALHPAGTSCGSGGCSAPNEAMTAPTCDGAGDCVPGTRVSCGSYRCRSGACLTSCAGGIDCYGPGGGCTGGVCTGAGDPGDACATAAECRTGFCVDGVCCRSSCTGLCRRCDGTLTGMPAGECGDIECSDPDDECGGVTPTCGGGVCTSGPVC